MHHAQWLDQQASRTLTRLIPRIEPLLKADGDAFLTRLHTQFPTIFRLLHEVYGSHYDFFYHLEQILISTAEMFNKRPADLKALDAQREADPLWFKSEKTMGGVCYVDLFAGNLEGVRAKIPYFRELGLTYLHLMPLFKAPAENNDGGYAVSDYRSVSPNLGTMEDLAQLAQDLREQGISLVVDFVFNHTSDEHAWALQALAGSEAHQEFYYMFDDRTIPDQYERTLREIFPEQAPGSFTYRPEVKKWVWTTFREFQWDLNYSNPAVFNAMLQELLFLANQGVEILRLDAVAFIWKQMGTSCENLPQAHLLIQAFNAMVRVAAPSMLFKSEAIVHPDDVASYIDWGECPISYNPLLMALLWEALATRNVKLLYHSMSKRFDLPTHAAAWVNYVRCHDDIGWTFADEDAAELWMNGYDHRQFLNRFYTGRFEGSFAKGVPFNYNPVNQDMRISGMAASLAGLEQALDIEDPALIRMATGRLLLVHSIILSAGGIPLIYLGDEIATTNDYTYVQNPVKKEDSRWVHRPTFDWNRAANRAALTTPEGVVFQGMRKLIELRKSLPAFAGSTRFFHTGNDHVLGYVRGEEVTILANFTEQVQTVRSDSLTSYLAPGKNQVDLVSGKQVTLIETLTLAPYQVLWLKNA